MEKCQYNYYRGCHLEDFVLDSRFREWVQEGKDGPFWEWFILQFPEKQDEIKEAKRIVENLSFKEICLSQEYKNNQLKAIYQKIDKRKEKEIPFYKKHFYFTMATAATIVLLLVSSWVYWQFIENDYVEYYAGYRETRNIYLQDGTEVMLNASSTLKSFASMSENAPREVWLKGEAFFNVKSLNSSDIPKKFIVHTPELDIEVLGTQFNVKNRDTKTRVFLKEGAVKIDSKKTRENVFMKPGEMIELTTGKNQLEKILGPNNNEIAWQDNLFDFENVALERIAKEMEHYYGKKVIFKDESLRDEIFTVKVPRNDLTLLLQLIGESFSLEIEETKRTIIFKNK